MCIRDSNYPFPKPPSDLDVGLPDRIPDADYLHLLDEALALAFENFTKENAAKLPPSLARVTSHESRVTGAQPDLIFYLAGADPYREDQLGGLALTKEGLAQRDAMVLEAARDRAIPIAVVLAGGYARRVEDTVQIHTNTILTARACFTSPGRA